MQRNSRCWCGSGKKYKQCHEKWDDRYNVMKLEGHVMPERTLIKSPEYYLDVVVGEYDAPPHKGGTVEKCTFCKNLIDRGDVPACMQLCPGRARYWGDLDDPESDVSKAIEGRETMFLNEEAGTKPSVYYLQ